VSELGFTLRPYAADDEEAAITLWQRTWQATYPDIDFAERLPWWRERWRNELVRHSTITMAQDSGELIGFVTVDPVTGYLDQLVVAPEAWGSPIGSALIDEAKRLAPGGLALHVNVDNARAITFYAKHGFTHAGGEVNPVSGRPVFKLSWRP
jgi:putative acetyltransferase